MVKTLISCALFLVVFGGARARAQNVESGDIFTVARLKYAGGGDWYANPSSLPNLLRTVQRDTGIIVTEREARASIMDPDFFSYPFIYMTGHGNVRFTEAEVGRLRHYLTHGGFLHADDNYGMDEYFRREIKRVFPDKELVELPFDYGIYRIHHEFREGLPKIHEHHGGPPHGYGIFHEGRLVVFYSYNTDLGDGWEDPEVHNDPPEKREAALKMGVNIVVWALLN